jgi:Flp pilus assembly protein TadG
VSRWRRRCEGGQSLIEFAIVLPVVALVVFGLLDLGRAVYSYNTLAQAARQANRAAIVDQDPSRVAAVAIANGHTLGLSSTNVTVCFKIADASPRDCTTPTIDECPLATRVLGCLAIVTTSTSVGSIEYVCPTALQPSCP